LANLVLAEDDVMTGLREPALESRSSILRLSERLDVEVRLLARELERGRRRPLDVVDDVVVVVVVVGVVSVSD
jgi:hypothetical protein